VPRIDYAYPSHNVAQQMSDRRGGSLTPLDLLLSHNDGLANGWNTLLGAVRSEFRLPGDLREMAILRIGRLNSAPYEWDAHLPVARREGLPEDVIAALLADAPGTGRQPHDAVLRYVDEMTRNVVVSEDAFNGLREHFDDTLIAELTATVAVYNMVSRFLVALDVHTADRDKLPPCKEAAASA
jgi:4-carboxymuconolactone decarboxylase